jgi:hypothetical protein
MWFRVRMREPSGNVSRHDASPVIAAFTLSGSRSVTGSVAVDSDELVQHRIAEVIAKAFLTVGRRGVLALGSAALLQTLGCTVIIDADRKQCKVDADCTNRGEAFANTVCVNSVCDQPPSALWGCMDDAPPEPLPPATYNVTMHAQFIVGSAPIPNIPAKLCRKIDPECKTPEATGTTDPNGDVTFQIPSNLTGAFVAFDAFDETLPPGEERNNSWVPANYFFNPNVTSDMTVPVQMATFGLLTALSGLVERPQEPDRGTVLINVLSCLGTGAPGVVYKASNADDSTTAFYVEGSVPVKDRTNTNTDGFGGFLNIIPGNVVVSGEIDGTDRVVDTVSLAIFPNTITYSRLVARAKPPIPQ